MNTPQARFVIHDTFRITGRGIVLTGNILEGVIYPGNFIRFDFNGRIMDRKITGMDLAIRIKDNRPKAGLLIACENELEENDLRNWNPHSTVAAVYGMIELG